MKLIPLGLPISSSFALVQGDPLERYPRSQRMNWPYAKRDCFDRLDNGCPVKCFRSMPKITPFMIGVLAVFRSMIGHGAPLDAPAEFYPPSPYVVDVTQPPYGAKGDGITDDTEALQRALNEHVGQHHMLLFPPGTYLIRGTLTWPKKYDNHDNWGFTFLHGTDPNRCRIRLQDGAIADSAKPAAMMWCGGFGSADWFHNYIENLTFDIGAGNRGATALQFYSNNSGAIRNCRFIDAAGVGVTGIDLGHRDMNGPLLVEHCEVIGFERGVSTAGAVNSQTFEALTLRGQRSVGFENSGQAISIRQLESENRVPALKTYGTLALLGANLRGQAGASGIPAIINYNGGAIWLRDVVTTGYGRAVADVATPDSGAAFRVQGTDKPGSLGPSIREYSTRQPTEAFPSLKESIRLPIEEPPAIPWDLNESWANVDALGADPTGGRDSAESIQRAIDSGAKTVFLPGSYRIKSTVTLRGKVRRLAGLGGMINYGVGERAAFRIESREASAILIDHFGYIGGGVEIANRQTVVFRSVSDCPIRSREEAVGGQLFLEDAVTDQLILRGQRVWARQLNIENEGNHLINDGGQLWILGYKTERGGTLMKTIHGGRTELLGGFSYTTTAGTLGPMFETQDSEVFAFFSEVCFNGNPFSTLVHEIRGEKQATLRRGQGHTLPYSGRGIGDGK